MTTIETLNSISQQLNIYLGLIMFFLGIFGSLWNILIFRHHTLRSSSSCAYMLFGSVASLIQILFGLLFRILAEGFHADWTLTNIAWCKIRLYIIHCASLTALSCLVCTAMDRFFTTCRQIKWRRLNSIYVAKQVCLLLLILWMITAIPTLIYAKPIQLTLTYRICASSSLIWSRISTYFFNLFCYGILPWLFMCLFGFFTLKNIHRIHRRRINPLHIAIFTRMTRIDNQLTSMLYLQIIICIISSIPYCIQSIYNSLTRDIIENEYRQAQDNLFLQIVHLTFYLNYISTFYVNYLSSPIFRQLSQKVFTNLFKKKDDVSRQITIINHQRNNSGTEEKMMRISTIHTLYSASLV
jgi:hypothetical protein